MNKYMITQFQETGVCALSYSTPSSNIIEALQITEVEYDKVVSLLESIIKQRETLKNYN